MNIDRFEKQPQSIGPAMGAAIAFCFLIPLLTPNSVLAQRGGPAPVMVAEVISQPVAAGQRFVGTVKPSRTAAVGSAVSGRVADYPVNEGDFVEKGTALAQLLTATITLELEAAERELDLRRHEYDELKNGSRPEEIAQAEAAQKAAQAVQKYQQDRLKRAQSLIDRGAINPEELQLIISQTVKAEQDLNQAVANFKLVKQGPREERILQAQAQVKIQEAVVEKLKDQVGKHTMRVPFDGFISAEHTELGQWVQSGELVAEVIALGEVDITAYVPEQSVRFVKKGQSVNVEISALPDQLFTGEVVLIVPQADVRSRTFPVKVRVKNTIDDNGPLIKSGMMAGVTLPTGTQSESLLVPKDAIRLGMDQKMVYVITDGKDGQPQSVRPVPVTIGTAEGTRIVVRGDLKAGDQVVIRGNDRIRPGQPIQIVESITAAP